MIILTKPSYFERLKPYGSVYDKLPFPFPKTDLVVSYCYPKRIPKHIYSKQKTINFHPAPSNYKGADPYTDGFNDKVLHWGTTVFKIEQDEYDSGEIIHERSFDLVFPPESREDLRCLAHHYCFQLFTNMYEPQLLQTQ